MAGWGRLLKIKGKKISFITGLAVALMICAGGVGMGASRVHAIDNSKDCDNNAIIHCGFTSASNFIQTVKSNNSGNGHHDLQAIYAHFGLEPASYNRFVTYARPGLAYSDGRIVVDGQTVATNAKSIGRIASYQGSGYFSMNIKNAGTFYGNTNAKAFAGGVNALPVMVMFNGKGVMQFAVLSACGNPEFGNNVVPQYSCNLLTKTPVKGKLNTYTFTTQGSASNNATVAKVVYNFGDGATKTVNGANALKVPVTHTYTKTGTFTAQVTVYVNLPGNQQVSVTSAKCQTKVIVVWFECAELTGVFIDQSKMEVSLTAKANFGGGATFTGADFYFGDNVSKKNVQPNGTTATVTYTYATPGKYDAYAVLHFNVDGASYTAPTCAAYVTPNHPPTPECKPGVPVGSPACLPPPPSSPPPTLPDTGASNTITIFAGVSVAGFLVYRQLVFRKHRAAFAAAERGTSPLPLGDPLSDTPLEETPLAPPKHRTFRRKRPF